MGEFNSDDHYIYYCGQESLRRNGVVYNSKSVSSTCVAGKTGHPHGQQRELNTSTGLQET